MPIRWRLTFWFALILLVILALSGGVLYALVQGSLNGSVDDNLRAYTSRVHGTLPDLSDPNAVLNFTMIHSQLPAVNEFASPGIYIQIIDRSGNVVVKSDNLGAQTLPSNPSLIERGFQGTADIESIAAGEGVRVRIMVTQMHLQDQTLLLEIAQSLKPIDDTLERLRLALLAGALLALLLTALSGAYLVRRALAPVGRITSTADSIEASADLSRRVGYRGPMDEVGKLATTFDHMLEHLHRAFQSQKQLVADASHELRTPLTVIQGNIDLLKRNLSEADRLESLRAISAESKRMSRIVNDLLLLAETESGQIERPEEVRLKDIVLEEMQRARTLAGERRVLTGRLDELSLRGDAHKLRQLIGNLMDNAIKYTPDGGVITLSLFRDGDSARLEVADTGIGIAPEHLPHLFDRFYRVDKARSRASGGTGLGLAIVKGIAEQHGGKVTVASQPSKGSTFTVWLETLESGGEGWVIAG